MKKFFKVFKWIGLSLLSVLLLGGIIVALFMFTSPQFGRAASEEQKAMYASTGHYADGIFLNEEEINMSYDCHSIEAMVREMLSPDPNVAPKQNIPVVSIDPSTLVEKEDTMLRITWFGHSSFLIELDGQNILLDPVFGKYASPHPWFGRERFNEEMPIEIEELPEIDAIIISHDHYDHLDYPSIKKLKAKTKHFFVPLGVGNHLRRWKIAEERIHELDWWQEAEFATIQLAFTPSRHMSGRGLSDQSCTLWGSWVLAGKNKKLYFSGDGGYGKHFKAIGEKYGPFDIGLMECGQYNELWAGVHMMPEETVQAAIDVQAQFMVPIHWGAFVLATHSWTDPVERVTKKAQELNVPISTPQIGETITLGQPYPQRRWWEVYTE